MDFPFLFVWYLRGWCLIQYDSVLYIFFFGMILIYNGTDEKQVFISVEMPYIYGVTFFPSSFLISFWTLHHYILWGSRKGIFLSSI